VCEESVYDHYFNISHRKILRQATGCGKTCLKNNKAVQQSSGQVNDMMLGLSLKIYFTLSFFFVSFFTIFLTNGLMILSKSGELAATKPITAVDTMLETSGMY